MNDVQHEGDRRRLQVCLTHRRLAFRYDPTRPRKPYVVRTITTGWIGKRFLLNRRLQTGFRRDQFRAHPMGEALGKLAEEHPGVWIAIPPRPQRDPMLAN